ncbi:MAG: hypothetical protein LBM04_12480, partial [Opitutaceae bacterium]|nr:hypothetical protein [Opitutaceae bacterium]
KNAIWILQCKDSAAIPAIAGGAADSIVNESRGELFRAFLCEAEKSGRKKGAKKGVDESGGSRGE